MVTLRNRHRLIVEIMWADFAFVAFDQIINQAANVRYVSRGRLTAPITIRTQQGAVAGSCAQHSQSVEGLFAHVPGIRICVPSTVQDAYDLTLSAIASDDPVVVIEHRALYPARGEVQVEGVWPTPGGAVIRRPGHDVTVVARAPLLHRVLAQAASLGAEGIAVEVVDPRWLTPFDTDTVIYSVARTGRPAAGQHCRMHHDPGWVVPMVHCIQ